MCELVDLMDAWSKSLVTAAETALRALQREDTQDDFTLVGP